MLHFEEINTESIAYEDADNENKPVLEETTADVARIKNDLKTAEMSLKEIIIAVLQEKPGLKSSKIGYILETTKKEVNQILYANDDIFAKDFLIGKGKSK
jgi:hypothetical protein